MTTSGDLLQLKELQGTAAGSEQHEGDEGTAADEDLADVDEYEVGAWPQGGDKWLACL
jgi:hypothetical protein